MRNCLQRTFNIIFFSTLFAGIFLLFSHQFLCAQESFQKGENTIEQTGDGEYNYLLEGRNDPFKPFLTPKAAASSDLDPNEIVEEDTVLSGMQLFEPGQLNLVAVVFSTTTSMAMVEDVTGKGYMLKEGVPIGRRGIVSRIDNQQVIITETARTRAGQELKSTVTMKLKKEGDN